MPPVSEPHQALAPRQPTRQAVSHVKTPFGHEIACALLAMVLIGGQALPGAWPVLTLAGSFFGVLLANDWWRKRTGFSIRGHEPRPARWVWLTATVLVAALALTVRFSQPLALWWSPLVLAGAGGLVTVIAGRVWMRMWRAGPREAV